MTRDRRTGWTQGLTPGDEVLVKWTKQNRHIKTKVARVSAVGYITVADTELEFTKFSPGVFGSRGHVLGTLDDVELVAIVNEDTLEQAYTLQGTPHTIRLDYETGQMELTS